MDLLSHWLFGDHKKFGESMKKSPIKTLSKLLVLGIVALTLTCIAAIAVSQAVHYFGPKEPKVLFRTTKTIYSNVVPNGSVDIIDLDHAGTLTPAPNNSKANLSPAGDYCILTNKPEVDYSKGILLILNLPATFSYRDPQDLSKKTLAVSFYPCSELAYFTFKVGETHEIKMNGRIFLVTLSRINDLTTNENGTYFSYVFDINEQ